MREEEPLAKQLQDIIGESPALTRMLNQAAKIAAVDAPVLIFGETGSGKESIARAIHRISARRHQSFVKVSCSTATASTLENRLIGNHPALNPQARGQDPLALANRGILFLDEIASLSPYLQAKLLSVLDRGEYEPMDGSPPILVNVRLMATTAHDLKQNVAAELFRKDLSDRLHELSLRVPPLRERRDDIPLLAGYFMGKFARRFGKSVNHISDDALHFLKEAHWPGNIRQLEVLVEHAVARSAGRELQLRDFGDWQEPEAVNG